MPKVNIDSLKLFSNVIRGLSMDAIQKANSGHPGLPLGMADVAAVLWLEHLNITPKVSKWANRDRFVLSGGHGSAMLYSLLHLFGYKVTMDDLKSFRQYGSVTPGHPERGETDGVEVTTGPLGQGFANAVGLAMAERMAAARLNNAERCVIDNYTYVFMGDGDMMEGISHEAASLAGNLKLNKLIAFYDSNNISIEGNTACTFTDDTAARFKAYGWRVFQIDGHDYEQISATIRRARKVADKPILVICKTTIGKGSPNKAGTAKVHGEPLGVEEIVLAKQALGLPAEDFWVPAEVYELARKKTTKCTRLAKAWERKLASMTFSAEEQQLLDALNGQYSIPENIALPTYDKAVATRAASGKAIQALTAAIPNLIGGSADLAPSNKTWIDSSSAISADDFSGRNIHFGVRELAMAAIQNGMIAYGGFYVFSATFFVFADYVRPAMRVAAISKLPAIYLFSHDSFYVGEDGATHEPIEQLSSLRAMPNTVVIRPADPTETAQAWLAALRNTTGPTAILVTRQNLEPLDRSIYPAPEMLEKGAYVLCQTKSDEQPDAIIIATGSEVQLALKAYEQLKAEGKNLRVVNMPSWELFEKQSKEYQETVLPKVCTKRIVIEAASSFGWERYIGAEGLAITIDHFGASAPYKVLEQKFGFTQEAVVEKIKNHLQEQ